MHSLFRHAVSSLLIVAASNAAAGVITQDGVVFTSSFTGNVLTLEIDAAGRSGGWAGASAIDALALKTIGSFASVSMSSSTGAAWSLLNSELKASGCGAARSSAAGAGMTRLCYTGAGVALADDMRFTFTFTGTPTLVAPHLKVHFVDARGNKVGSLLSLDFPAQGSAAPVATAPDAGSGTTPLAPELIPSPLAQPPIPAAGGLEGLQAGMPDPDEDGEVPEPGQLALMGAGLAMLGLVRRRKPARATNSAIG